MSKKIPEGCRRVQLTCTLIVRESPFGKRIPHATLLQYVRDLASEYPSDPVNDVRAIKFSELDEK